MNDHDLAAAYVLGALDPEEAQAFEERLATSEALRHEVTELREVSSLLALGSPAPPRSDEALKQRLLNRIRGDKAAGAPPRTARGSRRVLGMGWAAAAAAAVIVIAQRADLGDTQQRLASLERDADSLSAELASREATLQDILDPETSLIQLTATGQQAPGIQLFWNANANRVVLRAFNLPPAPTGRAYQLWFLGSGAPVPGGTFDTRADGNAVVTLDGPADGTPFAGAAVTVEPAGGSSAPTSPIIMAGERS